MADSTGSCIFFESFDGVNRGFVTFLVVDDVIDGTMSGT